MSLRACLVLMTVIAVVSDSMLHPFYPQYFARVLGVSDPNAVGLYIAACSLTVMVSLPLWARLERRIPVLKLLIVTQLAACALSLLCASLRSVASFWLLSLAMMVCKASYLLIYPYVMMLEDKRHHIATISLLAFVVYFGNSLAALLGGALFQLIDATYLFVAMACGDLLQVALCVYLVARGPLAAPAALDAAEANAAPLPRRFVAKLGVVMFVLYFSAYLSDPFFSSYWEGLTRSHNKIASGFVFAIPGLAALLALYRNSRVPASPNAYAAIAPAIVLAAAGLSTHLSSAFEWLLVGRFIYGWALFQCMVRLDLLLFRLSHAASYSVDFSKINLFQGLGVLAAGYGAGAIVSHFGQRLPFVIAVAGFLLGFALFVVLFRRELALVGRTADRSEWTGGLGHES